MFRSLANPNDFSVQLINSRTGEKGRWFPVKDEKTLFEYLSTIGDTIYRVAGIDYLSNIIMVTHRFCERMIWGFEGFGRGVILPEN